METTSIELSASQIGSSHLIALRRMKLISGSRINTYYGLLICGKGVMFGPFFSEKRRPSARVLPAVCRDCDGAGYHYRNNGTVTQYPACLGQGTLRD